MEITIADGKLKYRKWFQKHEVLLSDIEWAYLQQEQVHVNLGCCGGETSIGRLIVIKKNGEKLVFEYEGMRDPKRALEEIQAATAEIAIGYTKENRERFGVEA